MTVNSFAINSVLRAVRPFTTAHTFCVSRDGPRNSVPNKTEPLLCGYDYEEKRS